jgi:hypothetical protein
MRDQMLKIADRLEKRAEAIINNLWRDYSLSSGEPYPKSEIAGALNIMAEEIREALEPVKMHHPPGFGSVFKLADFVAACELGAFVHSDGEGFYGTALEESDRIACPARIAGGDIDKQWTHVYWYNK